MCQSLNNCIFKTPQWYTCIAPEMRALFIWFMRERNVTAAVRCVVMRNVACISASCIFKIPRRLLWWDSLWYTSATQDNSLWSLNHYEERTNLSGYFNTGGSGRWQKLGNVFLIFQQFRPEARGMWLRLWLVITASRVQCPPQYWPIRSLYCDYWPIRAQCPPQYLVSRCSSQLSCGDYNELPFYPTS